MVVIEVNNIIKLLINMGFDYGLLWYLHHCDEVSVDVGFTRIILKVDGTKYKLKFPTGLIASARKGLLKNATKIKVRKQVYDVLSSKITYSSISFPEGIILDNIAKKPYYSFDNFVKLAVAEEEEDVQDILTKDPIPLLTASTMYTPVTATSEGSVYFLIAKSDNVKIAARIKDSSISIRVEGDLPKDIEALGLIVKNNEGSDYASIHFTVKSVLMARKSVLSVLSMFKGINTPFPQLELIM